MFSLKNWVGWLADPDPTIDRILQCGDPPGRKKKCFGVCVNMLGITSCRVKTPPPKTKWVDGVTSPDSSPFLPLSLKRIFTVCDRSPSRCRNGNGACAAPAARVRRRICVARRSRRSCPRPERGNRASATLLHNIISRENCRGDLNPITSLE